jgi:nucleoside-diphosphate-sugar epimerase
VFLTPNYKNNLRKYMIKNNKPKILIIGNLGYIGSVLTSYLRKKNPHSYLIGFDMGYFSGCVFSPMEISDFLLDEQIYGDVRAFNYELLNGVDHVIYLAAISNDPMGSEYADATHHINALAAEEIANESKLRGGRSFAFASSCSMYGAGGDQVRAEEAELQPLTPYAKSKVEAENLLKPLASNEFIVTCLRFATACGASPRLRLDLVLNDFVVNALINKRIEILSDGTPWRPLIAVEDMCEALDWASQRTTANGGNFLAINAGFCNWNYTVKELAYLVQDALPGTEVLVNPNAAVDKRSYKVSFKKYEQYSGRNQSRKDINQVISTLIESINQANFHQSDFRKSIFIRLIALREEKNRGRLNNNLEWLG